MMKKRAKSFWLVANKWWVFWPLLIAYVFLWAITSTTISEYRWVRDLRGLTPFSDVYVSRVSISGDQARVWGSLEKTRGLCKRVPGPDGISAWVRLPGSSTLIPAKFSSSSEFPNIPENRPESPYPGSFGPWVITSPVPAPSSVTVYVFHDCPEGRVSNEVFDIQWENQP